MIESNKSPATVLVVDDDPEVRELVTAALAPEHIATSAAEDAAQAEALVRGENFDVLICDICLPGKDGLELLRHISESSPLTKTILITGRRRLDWAQQALRHGAFDYLEKPFTITVLQEAVQRAITHQRARQNHLDPRRLVDRQCLMVVNHAGIISFVGDGFAEMLAASPVASVRQAFDDVLCPEATTFAALLEMAHHTRHLAVNLQRAGGEPFAAEVTIDALPEGPDCAYLVRVVDLTPVRVLSADDSAALAVPGRVGHDALTGLPNHSRFQEELERTRSACRRHRRSLAVMIVNVDQLRGLNATYGHTRIDCILVALAQLLRRQVRAADYVARYSGDQFAIILPDTIGPAALTLAERVREAIAGADFTAGGAALDICVSIGVAECQTGFIESQNDLLANAEQALRQAQGQPENPVALWRPGLGTVTEDEAAAGGPQAELNRRLRTAHLAMARALVAAVEAKDAYTKDHSLNVAEYAEYFARRLGLDADQISVIRCAASLHDVGKIGVPDAVLTKPGKLTEEEFQIIKTHPVIGAEILSQSDFLEAEAEIVRHHHERCDGRGYPDGLTGDEMSLGARIMQVADSLDAMLCARYYKPGYDLGQVSRELQACAGSQFDPDIARLADELVRNHPERLRYSHR